MGRVGEVRSLITPRLDTLINSKKDAMIALNKSVLIDHRGEEMYAYILSGLINILENFKKGWDDHLLSLKTIFEDIFKFW